MLAEKNPYHLQVISQDKQKRMEYEAREKAVRDYNQGILEAEQRGKNGETIRIAKNLFHLGLSVEQIANSTGLSMEQIESLKK